jgi:nucleoside-diphosphate-sugar epimerase
MMAEKVLVTGASGFIGGVVVRQLVEAGFEVTGWGRKFWASAEFTYQQRDLLTSDLSHACGVVVHVAGLADDRSSKEAFRLQNVEATRRLLDASGSAHTFVYVSSGSVYKPQAHCYEEHMAGGRGLSAYGQSKLAGEELCKLAADRFERIVVLRPRGVYGPGDTTLLPRLMHLVKCNRLIAPGGGLADISLVHVDNFAASVLAAFVHAPLGYSVYNVADSRTYRLSDVLMSVLGAHTNQTLKLVSVPVAPLLFVADCLSAVGIRGRLNRQGLEYLSQSITLDTRKIGNELGFWPHAQLEDYISVLQQLNKPQQKSR